MDKINLLHGDCLELMKDIPDKGVDMILTDIPYGEVSKMGAETLNMAIATPQDNCIRLVAWAIPFVLIVMQRKCAKNEKQERKEKKKLDIGNTYRKERMRNNVRNRLSECRNIETGA